MTKPRLTPHQREVWGRLLIKSKSKTRPDGWVLLGHIGSRGALDKLVRAGLAEVEIRYGPGGGEHRYYRPRGEEELSQ